MTGEQKTGVWIIALLVAGAIAVTLSITYYYHQKSERQADAPRAAVNLDIECNVVGIGVDAP